MDDKDRMALEEKVAEGLSELSSDGPTDEPEDELTDEPTEPEDKPEELEDEPEGGDPEDDADEDDKDDGEAAADDDAPTLPDSYRRSLKAYGWTDEAIAKNLKLLGKDFIETASRIHANRNAELAQWAAAGRAARDQQNQGGHTQQSGGEQTPGIAAIKPLDVQSLKEKYGDDGLVDEIVGAVNPVIAAVNAIIPSLQQGQQTVVQAQQEALERLIQGFFSDASMKPYADLYGDGEGQLLPEQLHNRNLVLETADALVAGARQQGRNLTVQEALMMAHDICAADFKEVATRKAIEKKVKQRNKGITQKPGRRSTPKSGPLTRSELERKVSSKLSKVFG